MSVTCNLPYLVTAVTALVTAVTALIRQLRHETASVPAAHDVDAQALDMPPEGK